MLSSWLGWPLAWPNGSADRLGQTAGIAGEKARRKLHPLPILDNLEALVERAGGRERPGLLALDVSKRAIGVAGADASWQLATPLRTIRRRRLAQDLEALREIIRDRAAAALVIGLPLNMDGSEGPRCQSVRAFAKSLDAGLGLPMLLWDERLTTFAAKEAADRTGLRGRKRDEALDALAAAALLQDILDTVARMERRAYGGGPSPRISPRRP
jgi:putative Holliday junction resolvase